MRIYCLIAAALLLSWVMHGQDQSSSSRTAAQPPPPPAVRIGPGITPPRLKSKVEPTYSHEAQTERVQGTVVLEIVVDDHGLPRNIKVVSPLGFGLDERAEEAVEKWRFLPGEKDGRAVSIQATVEVNFRLSGISFDQKLEQRRTSFNEAGFSKTPGPGEPGQRR